MYLNSKLVNPSFLVPQRSKAMCHKERRIVLFMGKMQKIQRTLFGLKKGAQDHCQEGFKLIELLISDNYTEVCLFSLAHCLGV